MVTEYGFLLNAKTRKPIFKLTFDHRVNHLVDEVLLGIIPINLNLKVRKHIVGMHSKT